MDKISTSGLTILGAAPSIRKNRPRLRCMCSCGTIFISDATHIYGGHTKSCGCLKIARINALNSTHGLSKTVEYRIWRLMRSRCNAPTDKRYPEYGARGIYVCDEWNSFEKFLEDMGSRPTRLHSIDRIDVNGPYSKENCRWATQKQQCNNKRNNVLVAHGGRSQTIQQWAEELSIPQSTVHRWIRVYGKTLGDLISSRAS